MNVYTFRPHSRRFIALCEAGEFGQAAELLDRHDYVVSDRNYSGETPLHWLAVEGDIDGVRLLLARGADANTADHHGDTVLSDACSLALVQIAELLLRHRADPRWTHRHNKETALHAAARCSTPDPRIVDVMHDAGADLNARTHLDETPLDACVLTNNTTIARRLLERGADVNLGGECFGPPLHHAASDDKLAMIDLLIDCGASIELLSGEDETPLMAAIRYRHWAAAGRLLARGANPETRNSAGKVAADFVTFPEDHEVWQSMLRASIPPSPV